MTTVGHYSLLDRMLHCMAFANLALQQDLAALEDRRYGARLGAITPRAPVFVTGLPRAGTTLLLNILAEAPGFASHTYRDMPFLLCPMLWRAMSTPFRRQAVLRERSHGDGVVIGFDSPEAFEEVFWRQFFPSHYQSDRIDLWGADEAAEPFQRFFTQHMRKIIALRLGDNASNGRYVSKNNANIARLPLLRRLFPDCRIVVPFRHPLAQAASLLRQHLLFLELHAQSGFARRYMDWLGHLEFGANLRPIAFPEFETHYETPSQLDFWLRYWTAAYAHILSAAPNLVVFSYETLCAHPVEMLRSLARSLDEPDDTLLFATNRIRAAERHDSSLRLRDPTLLSRADAIYSALLGRSIGPTADNSSARNSLE